MIAPIVGGVIGTAIFAFLYTGWDQTVTRWRETEDPLLRAAQVVVAILSNLGLLLLLLTAGIAAVASFVVYREDNPLLVTLAAIGVGLFIGSYVLGFALALFITGADRAAPSQASRSRTKRKRKKKRRH